MQSLATSPFITESGDCLNLNVGTYSRCIHINIGKGVEVFNQNLAKEYLINDSNPEIISFYKSLTNPLLLEEINKLATNWKLIAEFSKICSNEIFISYTDFENKIISIEDVQYMVRAIVLMNIDIEKYNQLFSHSFLVSYDMFLNTLIKNTVIKLEKNKGVYFGTANNNNFHHLIESSFKYSFFNHFQNMLNLQNTNLVDCLEPQKQIAIWYFLSLLAKGNRMIYDINENLKSLYAAEVLNPDVVDEKLKYLTTLSSHPFLERTAFYNLPYHVFLKQISPKTDDFILVDFRTINLLKSSTQDLRPIPLVNNIINLVEKLPSKWVVLADYDTTFESLYGNSGFRMERLKNDKKDFILIANN
ncbi:MAG: hypothetical protein M0P66_05500 [Salinivirgaceae bacterium]|nr:hypothetical protein [Salinivirgaceae bacterium]